MPNFGTEMRGPLDRDVEGSARQRMIDEHLVARGICDRRVLEAFRRVRREDFIDPGAAAFAYDDRPLAIGEGQTISQPYIVALMASVLDLKPTDKVLEVGAGCGYASAIFACLCRSVVGIERLHGLALRARANLARAHVDNVEIVVGDGTTGSGGRGPFDAIVVSAGGPSIPSSLVSELSPGGRMVIPVGVEPDRQELVKVERSANGELTTTPVCGVHFVKLVGREGWPA